MKLNKVARLNGTVVENKTFPVKLSIMSNDPVSRIKAATPTMKNRLNRFMNDSPFQKS